MGQHRNSPWRNEAADAELRRLSDLKYSASEIAVALCVKFDHDFSRNSIIGRRHRLGIKGGGGNAIRIAAVKSAPTKRQRHSKLSELIYPPAMPKPASEAPMHQPGLPTFGSDRAFIVTHRQTVKFMELKRDCCKWPTGPVTSKAVWFCGAPTPEGCSYCRYHHAIATAYTRGINPLWARAA